MPRLNNKLDIPIYRVLKISYLIDMIKTSRNTLVKPKLWDDPYENSFLKQKFYTNDEYNGKTFLDLANFTETLYGQCWTLTTDETDALWRIYSPNKDGIRIKTTLRKLHESLFKYVGRACFLDEVEYKEKTEIDEAMRRTKLDDMIPEKCDFFVKQLFIKREEFRHEHEVRLVYQIPELQRCEKCENIPATLDLFRYPIEPLDFIEEILFDPRTDKNLVDAYKNNIKSLGINGDIINQSDLYQLNEDEICLD